MTADLVARFGAWSAEKIEEEMERELRNKRLSRGEEDKT